jgi:putative heme transporter
MAGIASARVRAYAGRAFALALVVGIFAFVLPRVADYGDVWDALSALSNRGVVALLVTATVNLATFGPPWMAALPDLSFLHALVMSQASTAAASVLPGGDAVGIAISYSMLRRWGFTVEQVTVGSAATTVWNVFANVIFAVAAAGFLATAGESHPLLTTLALFGAVAVGVAVVLFAVALNDDANARLVGGLVERAWNGVARLLHRTPASGWDERLAGFRREAVGLLKRRWLALTAATLAGHLTVFLVLFVALRAVGVTAAQVSLAEAFAAWALIRIITTIPLTPGGLGVVELGLTGALVTFGGHQAKVVAAVLLYRVLTYVPPIAMGGVCLLVWRRLAGVRGESEA